MLRAIKTTFNHHLRWCVCVSVFLGVHGTSLKNEMLHLEPAGTTFGLQPPTFTVSVRWLWTLPFSSVPLPSIFFLLLLFHVTLSCGKHLPSSWCVHGCFLFHPGTTDTHASSFTITSLLLLDSVCVCACLSEVCWIEQFPYSWQIKRNISLKLGKGHGEHKLQKDLLPIHPAFWVKSIRSYTINSRGTIQLVFLSVRCKNKNVI